VQDGGLDLGGHCGVRFVVCGWTIALGVLEGRVLLGEVCNF